MGSLSADSVPRGVDDAGIVERSLTRQIDRETALGTPNKHDILITHIYIYTVCVYLYRVHCCKRGGRYRALQEELDWMETCLLVGGGKKKVFQFGQRRTRVVFYVSAYTILRIVAFRDWTCV